MSISRNITDLLFPTGRAHKVGEVGNALRNGMTDGFSYVDNDIDNLLNGVLPDNPDFTIEWCKRHEKMYGLSTFNSDTLQDRINRIKMHLTPPNPQLSLISQSELQAEIDNAGWGGILYIHENLQGQEPIEVLPQLSFPNQLGNHQLGDFQLGGVDATNDYPQFYNNYQLNDFQLGDAQLGDIPQFNNKIANHLDRNRDIFVNYEPIEHTFFVCGVNLGDIVQLPASDEIPLRQLLLNIKPASAVGFLLIEYV